MKQDVGDELSASVTQTALGFERLLADHLKLVRLELVSDAKSLLRNLRGAVVLLGIALVGYLLAAIGVAIFLAQWFEPTGAFLVMGGLHGAAAGAYALGGKGRTAAAAATRARRSRDRGAQDRGAQDRGAQDRGAQDRGAQDRGAQDRGAQVATPTTPSATGEGERHVPHV